MKLRRFASVLAVLALMGVWMNRSVVVTHADNTLSLATPSLTYTHGPFVYPNVTDQVGPPNCSVPQSCDDYPLTVSVPAGTDATKQINICFSYDQSTDPEVDFDIWVYDSKGNVIASNVNPTPPNECVTIAAVSGSYTVRADPWFPGGESYTGHIDLVASPIASSKPPPDAATRATGIDPRYQDFLAPMNLGANTAGEPSIGVDLKTGAVMTSSDLQTLKVHFDDSSSPARATWSDISAFTSRDSLDPILFTDRNTGRTWVSQLTGQDSLTSFSDDDGATYTPSQGGGIPSGVDHQTIGAGPYHGAPPATVTYPDAVYYCSQDIATAFCARSDNGGQTFGAGIPIYNDTQCAGIHGHVKVGPDGTVYVPARSCGGKQGVAVSIDNGMTWTLSTIPDSTAAIGNDPSIGVATDNTLYFGYQGADGHARIAVSHDEGTTWSKSVDVGYLAGVQNSVFPTIVAGDPNRAAFSYLGTTTGGDFQSQSQFNGIWYLFTSTTYDGGKTWTTVKDTPDPVQRGSICIAGTTCSNTPDDRKLLDFIDSTIDTRGRVLVAYADGCIQQCITGLGSYDSTNSGQSQQSSSTTSRRSTALPVRREAVRSTPSTIPRSRLFPPLRL